MTRLCAQGDILVWRVDDAAISGQVVEAADEGAAIIPEGEASDIIMLERGTYRVRRQRQLEPTDVGIHEQLQHP